MTERGLKICMCRTALRMEGGVFFKEVRMEGGRGSEGPASHTRTFPDLVPPGKYLKCFLCKVSYKSNGKCSWDTGIQ